MNENERIYRQNVSMSQEAPLVPPVEEIVYQDVPITVTSDIGEQSEDTTFSPANIVPPQWRSIDLKTFVPYLTQSIRPFVQKAIEERRTSIANFSLEDFAGIQYVRTAINNVIMLKRQGWINHGVPAEKVESVAAHMAVMGFIGIDKAKKLGLNVEKILSLSLVHDLAEGLESVKDITPRNGVSQEEKQERERRGIQEIGAKANQPDFITLWEEYEANETPEAKFVHQLDKYEMMVQAFLYEVEFPELDFSEFWNGVEQFDFGYFKEDFEELKLDLKSLRLSRFTQIGFKSNFESLPEYRKRITKVFLNESDLKIKNELLKRLLEQIES